MISLIMFCKLFFRTLIQVSSNKKKKNIDIFWRVKKKYLNMASGVITLFSLTKIFYHSQFLTLTFKFFIYLFNGWNWKLYFSTLNFNHPKLPYLNPRKNIYIYIYILKNTYSPPNPLNKNELIYVSSVLHYLRSSTDIHTDTILNK